jgi:hypothetical protein
VEAERKYVEKLFPLSDIVGTHTLKNKTVNQVGVINVKPNPADKGKIGETHSDFGRIRLIYTHPTKQSKGIYRVRPMVVLDAQFKLDK